ncbi:hypothetical protein BKA64DRAFT_337135 [Cadophora sp. MPI-SDFR-AT-0126]|nr:hypothetical protein BKA64DRAFT_337135 [Leotiomycetes sp. MPI-SDFR-AT-0126]
MPDTIESPSVTNQNEQEHFKGSKTSRQRFKPQLSCTFCRHRKLKCDRNLPCENCVKRNQATTCAYVHASAREKPSQVSKANSGGTASRDVQNQIRHLEEMVITLMNKTSKNRAVTATPRNDLVTPETSPDHGVPTSEESEDGEQVTLSGTSFSDTAESFGRISMEDDQANYVGSDHWAAILDNIACLKDQLGASGAPSKEKISLDVPIRPDLLVGSVRPATRAEILAAIPPRSVADAITNSFFETPDMGSTLIHVPTFRKEYETFWAKPDETPIMWIGLLFSIMCLATGFQVMSGQGTPFNSTETALRDPADTIRVFREKTVQCLVLDNYTEPGPWTVETLFLYYVSEHFRTADAQFGSWMIFGLMVRAAMRLGYHRDGSHYSKISVFKSEMQRRIWVSIVHMDLISSLQVGLPRMIREGSYDTRSPRNILDTDFDENTKVLPPERPYSEFTSIGYSNSKHRITAVFGQIVDQANSTFPISYSEVMVLDKKLHETYLQAEDPIRITSVDDLFIGSPTTRFRKFSVDLTFQKARCVLHRKFFVTSKTTASYPYPYSMKTCVEASMRILQSQILMDRETDVGHPLHGHRWKASSLLSHDFLLAAMLICLYIGNSIGDNLPNQGLANTGIQIKWTQEEMVDALQGSYKIWEERSAISKEALKAAKALKAMLEKVRAKQPVTGRSVSAVQGSTVPPAVGAHLGMMQLNPGHDDPSNSEDPSTFGDVSPSWTTGYGQSSAESNLQTYDSNQAMAIDALDWVRNVG